MKTVTPSDMIKIKDSQRGDNKINKTRFIYPSKKWLGSTEYSSRMRNWKLKTKVVIMLLEVQNRYKN